MMKEISCKGAGGAKKSTQSVSDIQCFVVFLCAFGKSFDAAQQLANWGTNGDVPVPSMYVR